MTLTCADCGAVFETVSATEAGVKDLRAVVEAMVAHLMQEHGLACVVKLNPTLLGAIELRRLLHEALAGPDTKVILVLDARQDIADQDAQSVRCRRRIQCRMVLMQTGRSSKRIQTSCLIGKSRQTRIKNGSAHPTECLSPHVIRHPAGL